jgi:hypothetical protein
VKALSNQAVEARTAADGRPQLNGKAFDGPTMLRSILLLSLCLVACNRGLPMRNHGRPATENTRLEIAAPETWIVEGTEVKEVASYYMVLEAGLQYTVDIARTPKSPVTVDEEAWPVIKFAFETKRYLRARIDAYEQKHASATRIGVRFRANRFEHRQDDLRSWHFRSSASNRRRTVFSGDQIV